MRLLAKHRFWAALLMLEDETGITYNPAAQTIASSVCVSAGKRERSTAADDSAAASAASPPSLGEIKRLFPERFYCSRNDPFAKTGSG
jgi:hypothetical protein